MQIVFYLICLMFLHSVFLIYDTHENMVISEYFTMRIFRML